MLINNDEQYCAIWDRVYNELGFKPSCDYRGHSLRVPLPFKLEEPYVVYGFDDMTDDQIDLVTETMKKSLIEITHVGECMYALDWHHEAFLYDPRNPDEQRSVQYKDNSTRGYSIAYFPSFILDGDYHFFIEENFAFGYLGHPWRQEIWVFGNRLVEKTEEAYQKFGWTKIK